MLEGNIGVGKSTLAARMARQPGIVAVRESIGPAFLAAFYSDPDRYGFALQMTQHAARLGTLRHALVAPAPVATVLDRSILGDYAFALWNAACGHLSPLEWRLYTEQAGATVAAALEQSVGASAASVHILFLHDTAAACFARQAARDGGAGIEYAYMVGLEAAHLVVLACVPPRYALTEYQWDEYAAATRLVVPATATAVRWTLVDRARAAVAASVFKRQVREFMTMFLAASLAAARAP